MMKYLYKEIDWSIVDFIGFDMDGTLYDEFEFIVQPYAEIAKHFINSEFVFNYMCNLWLQNGSSYNNIFSDTYNLHKLSSSLNRDEFVDLALNMFRNFNPKLCLSSRVKSILQLASAEYKLFLVSDGNPILQKKKFLSLGLDNFLSSEFVVFTGEYTRNYEKPNTNSLDILKIVPEKSVFFGDRKNDKDFAISSNMQFQKVYNMHYIG